MKPFLYRNRVAYLVLLFLLTAFVCLFLLAWPDRAMQRWYAGGFAVSYFIWGVSTHIGSKSLTSEIVFEYLAMALLASLLIILITL